MGRWERGYVLLAEHDALDDAALYATSMLTVVEHISHKLLIETLNWQFVWVWRGKVELHRNKALC